MEQRMRLSSSAFADGAMIPRRFTCDGQNLSPPLTWTDVPNGAHSLVMLCDDPDAPGGTWHHWAVYDVPRDRAGLPEGVSPRDDGFKQATNDFRRVGYGGPCPPHGHGPHHYHFRLLALSVEQLRPRRGPSCEEVEREARQHIIAEATLVGVYKR
jgi:Raf kinase inhibitor-like YbhB/YbcL family protein